MVKAILTHDSKIIVFAALLAGLFFVPGAGLAAMSTEDFIDVCQTGTPQQIEAALKDGADVNTKNNKGETPLMFAASSGNPDLVPLLLSAGADVNAKSDRGSTPLMWAASDGDPDIVALLLKAGANVNAKNVHGWTPDRKSVV
jgi:ankyrin repeat protein